MNEHDNASDYLKENYDEYDFLTNTKILSILEMNRKRDFYKNIRSNVERLKQKYISLYGFTGIFKRDEYNHTWERLLDIIYYNVQEKYFFDVIYDDPQFFINILEK